MGVTVGEGGRESHAKGHKDNKVNAIRPRDAQRPAALATRPQNENIPRAAIPAADYALALEKARGRHDGSCGPVCAPGALEQAEVGRDPTRGEDVLQCVRLLRHRVWVL